MCMLKEKNFKILFVLAAFNMQILFFYLAYIAYILICHYSSKIYMFAARLILYHFHTSLAQKALLRAWKEIDFVD